MRRMSANAATSGYGNDGRLSATGRSLSDLSWLDRRRSLNVVVSRVSFLIEEDLIVHTIYFTG